MLLQMTSAALRRAVGTAKPDLETLARGLADVIDAIAWRGVPSCLRRRAKADAIFFRPATLAARPEEDGFIC
jgi:hypothetical protein